MNNTPDIPEALSSVYTKHDVFIDTPAPEGNERCTVPANLRVLDASAKTAVQNLCIEEPPSFRGKATSLGLNIIQSAKYLITRDNFLRRYGLKFADYEKIGTDADFAAKCLLRVANDIDFLVFKCKIPLDFVRFSSLAVSLDQPLRLCGSVAIYALRKSYKAFNLKAPTITSKKFIVEDLFNIIIENLFNLHTHCKEHEPSMKKEWIKNTILLESSMIHGYDEALRNVELYIKNEYRPESEWEREDVRKWAGGVLPPWYKGLYPDCFERFPRGDTILYIPNKTRYGITGMVYKYYTETEFGEKLFDTYIYNICKDTTKLTRGWYVDRSKGNSKEQWYEKYSPYARYSKQVVETKALRTFLNYDLVSRTGLSIAHDIDTDSEIHQIRMSSGLNPDPGLEDLTTMPSTVSIQNNIIRLNFNDGGVKHISNI
jgi:hypothetical protein